MPLAVESGAGYARRCAAVTDDGDTGSVGGGERGCRKRGDGGDGVAGGWPTPGLGAAVGGACDRRAALLQSLRAAVEARGKAGVARQRPARPAPPTLRRPPGHKRLAKVWQTRDPLLYVRTAVPDTYAVAARASAGRTAIATLTRWVGRASSIVARKGRAGGADGGPRVRKSNGGCGGADIVFCGGGGCWAAPPTALHASARVGGGSGISLRWAAEKAHRTGYGTA